MARSTKRKHAGISNLEEGSPESQDGNDSGYGTQSPTVAECPFSIEYVQPQSTGAKTKKRKSVDANSDTSPEKLEEDVLSKNMTIGYVIRPGTVWEAMKKYRNFVVGDETFGVNDFVSVNHSNIAHGALLSTDDEKLFWIARVLEVRASDSQHVYLRVFWMYWPDELPGGARDYHGKHELIASNHMEIIDAMTVAGKANVSHWLEKDEEKVLDALYWRQTFSFHGQSLSGLRQHCICRRFYNPDSTLIGCSHADCNVWMHEQCAIDDALSRTYQRRLGGEGAIDGTNKETKKGRRKSKKAKATKNVWDGLFEAKIVPRQAEDAVEKANTIEDGTGEGDADRDESTKDTRRDVEEEAQESQTDNREPKESAGKLVITDLRDEEQKTWEEEIVCIGCHRKVK